MICVLRCVASCRTARRCIGIDIPCRFVAFLRTNRFFIGGFYMENRLALIGIIVESSDAAERINAILHEFGPYIIGRMGIPYRERGVNIISIVIDAENNIISSLSGKLGMVKGVSVKTMYAKNGN